MSYTVRLAPEALDQLDAIEEFTAFIANTATETGWILGIFYGGQDYEAVLLDVLGN